MGAYYDAVVTERLNPIFNGTPDETREWIFLTGKKNEDLYVVVGRTMDIVPIKTYIEG
jgi:hypothetical protein